MKATGGRASVNPAKPRGETPTMVYVALSIRRLLPSTSGLAAYRVFQKSYDMTTTGVPDGGVSSSAVKKRPRTGWALKKAKVLALMTPTDIPRVSSPSPMASVRAANAPALAMDRVVRAKSRYLRY